MIQDAPLSGVTLSVSFLVKLACEVPLAGEACPVACKLGRFLTGCLRSTIRWLSMCGCFRHGRPGLLIPARKQ